MKMNLLTYSLLLAFMLVGAKQASATIVYSGPNRNIVYDEYEYHEEFSLFDAPGVWDDIHLSVDVAESPLFQNKYDFGNYVEVHGHYVRFALGDSHSRAIKNFAKGDMIDGSTVFGENAYYEFSSYVHNFDLNTIDEFGEFRNTTGYAGLRFTDGDDVFYGWMQVSVTNYDNSNITGTLIDWAYESTPGVGIQVGAIPEPTTYALLLAGAAGVLAILRRKRA